MAFALYANYGTLWYVAAFGIAAAGRVYKSSKDNSTVPVIVLPAIAAAGVHLLQAQHTLLLPCQIVAGWMQRSKAEAAPPLPPNLTVIC